MQYLTDKIMLLETAAQKRKDAYTKEIQELKNNPTLKSKIELNKSDRNVKDDSTLENPSLTFNAKGLMIKTTFNFDGKFITDGNKDESGIKYQIQTNEIRVSGANIYMVLEKIVSNNKHVYAAALAVEQEEDVKSIAVKWALQVNWTTNNGIKVTFSEEYLHNFNHLACHGTKLSPTPPKNAQLEMSVTIKKFDITYRGTKTSTNNNQEKSVLETLETLKTLFSSGPASFAAPEKSHHINFM